MPRARLEIVPVRVIKLSRPRIRRNHALNTTALRTPSITPTRSAHLRYTTRSVLLNAFRCTLDGNGTCARASLRLRLFALLDDLVFAIIGGGNAGGAVSSGVGGIGVGSTHSSSSRSVESDEIVREKSNAVSLVLCGRVLVLVFAALGVTGPTGSSSVPPPLPLWPLSEAGRKERRSGMTAPSPASKKSSEESSSSSSCVSPFPSGTTTGTTSASSSPSPSPAPTPTPESLSLSSDLRACHPRPPRDRTSTRGCRPRPTTTAVHQRSRKSFYAFEQLRPTISLCPPKY
jgi:hypothetical protein